ncbi:MAG: hypothetical protein KFH98_05935 [Gemmatimonadetes bacterium]|nr:hypothetical protein [Gemmatimonadota bacterium]
MHAFMKRVAIAAALPVIVATARADAQEHTGHAARPDTSHSSVTDHMFTRDLGAGWRILGMAQVFPAVSSGFGSGASDDVTQTEAYATQPAAMFNIESPGSRVVLRTTLNFEGVTQPDGELTFGGWGEGFIDRRHPHTLLHEAMLSVNLPDVAGGSMSVSAGRGFAPYGTDDPMSRPVVKYPTNHHLSQILERYTVNAVYLNRGWSVEAGAFDGAEPEGPYDFGNFSGFNSWSGRVTHRFGGTGVAAPWEVSASFAHVVETHDGEESASRLANAFVRHERSYSFGKLYSLIEASLSDPREAGDEGYFSVLGEVQLTRGRHQPYARVEVATRPEYERDGAPGTDGFFRYDHDAHAHAATRWVITSAGYGYEATRLPYSARPFIELQHNNAANARGDVSATELFGTTSFFSVTAGLRLFIGGGPMRMGSYGVLDAMTTHGAMMHDGMSHDGTMDGMDHTNHH